MSLQKFPSSLDTTEELWTFVRGLVIVVTRKWMTPDKSIWEIRGPERHFVYSKVMSWHAINQGVKIAQMLDKDFYAEEWGKIADTIKEDIFTNGWDEEVGAFVQYYGSKSLDAAILLMEETGIIEAGDPRYVSTVLRVRESLSVNGFMYRYIDEDDFGRPSGSFILCNFWMVNSLFKIGHTEDAIKLFENIMDCANHLGLLSEHINADSRELLGNFPQAYSHLGLVQSALLINGRDIEFTRDTFKFIKP
jgi:GH15 family glucan-1,4-alpha-glucosidase